MKDTGDETTGSDIGLHGKKPALQVICLGASGGPSEDNVTSFLVRSVGSEWARGSLLAVDAGSHLAPITRILEQSFPSVSRDRIRTASDGSHVSNGSAPSPTTPASEAPKPEPKVLTDGPFAGLKFPNESARANALHVLRTYVSTYLITHPHLDHLSGFAINTAAFHATSRPKTLAALPSTVNAIKQHIFNDIIWPNLTDEDGGVGFVTFQRLKEGGDVMVGEGEGRGYIDVCDGLGVRSFKVSHGTCTKGPSTHHHRGSVTGMSDSQPLYNGSIQGTSQDLGSASVNRSLSISQLQSTPGTPGRQSFHSHAQQHVQASDPCVVDSTAFFLRDEFTQREVIIFGDVEPDSISLSPRNKIIWQEAARKIAHGMLGGIFIECSYDDSQADALLFGHLSPRHLIAELSELARQVIDVKATREAEKSTNKRKRSGPNGLDNFARNLGASPANERKRSRSAAQVIAQNENRRRSSVPEHGTSALGVPPLNTPPGDSLNHYEFIPDGDARSERSADVAPSPHAVTFPRELTNSSVTTNVPQDTNSTSELPLSGIRVVIIHVKDTLKDGPHVSENILAQLNEYEAKLQEEGVGLGCEFVISQSGESYWF